MEALVGQEMRQHTCRYLIGLTILLGGGVTARGSSDRFREGLHFFKAGLATLSASSGESLVDFGWVVFLCLERRGRVSPETFPPAGTRQSWQEFCKQVSSKKPSLSSGQVQVMKQNGGYTWS